MSTTTPLQEEREARARARQLERARKESLRSRAKQSQSRLQAIIEEEQARRPCRCPMTRRTTLDEIMAMGSGCTAGLWICPTLDAIRRRMGR